MVSNPQSQFPNQGSLTTDPDRFSDECWNLLIDAQDAARRWKHEQMDVEHIMQVLFSHNDYKKLVANLPINKSELLDQLESFLVEQPLAHGDELFIGDALEDLLETANQFRDRWGSRLIEISHLLIALGRDIRIGRAIFEVLGLPSEKLEKALIKKPIGNAINKSNSLQTSREIIKQPEKNTVSPQEERIAQNKRNDGQKFNHEENSLKLEKEPKALDTYSRDLTSAAEEGQLDPVIGRDAEIRRLIKVLSRRGKNNPVLIGAPGVGKTAIAELLAQRIVANEVPDSLKGIRLVSLDLGALIAGAKFRGQVEERFRSVLAEVSDPDAGVMIFIDELHNVVSNDRSSADAGSLLKPLLARGDLLCIGATTPEHYRKTVEKDPALSRRFQQVIIKEPSLELSLEILRGLKKRYENHHGVTISDAALIASNRLADRYISDRCLPDKAIDLIDEAAAQIKIEETSKPQIIEEIESKLRRLDMQLLTAKNGPEKELLKIEDEHLNTSKRLANLNHQWEEERSEIKKLRQFREDEASILEQINEAEQLGNLEEAAILKYDQLYSLQQLIKTQEESNNLKSKTQGTLIKETVEADDIADVVARLTGIPVQKVMAGERQKLLNLESDLSKKVIGQSDAIKAVAAAIRRARAGMKDPRRPVGSFLFLGPTGVGKTELAKTLAASLFDKEEALVRLDMSEFMERNAVARLLGAPPGYVGYEEGGQLTEAVRQRPYAVLLLDEIEKAHPDVFNILLQVLDDGRLTDSQGRTVDFRHTVIVMTSNLAGREILKTTKSSELDISEKKNLYQNLNNQIDQALGKHFRPEFLNRIDEVIRFRPLQVKDLKQIVRLQIVDLSQLLAEQDLELRVDEEVIQQLAVEAYEPEFGARPLRRIIRRSIENPLATELLEESFNNANAVRVKQSDSKSLIFTPEN